MFPLFIVDIGAVARTRRFFVLTECPERGTQLKNDKAPKNVAGRVREFAQPVVEQLGYELWDVVFEKVGSQYELTVYIDSPDGIDMNDCEAVSHAIDPLLDSYDPIPQSYTFYVSSAGLERALTRPEHYPPFFGSLVDVRLYKAVDGAKQYEGILKAYDEGRVTIEYGEKEITFEPDDLASVRLVYVDDEGPTISEE